MLFIFIKQYKQIYRLAKLLILNHKYSASWKVQWLTDCIENMKQVKIKYIKIDVAIISISPIRWCVFSGVCERGAGGRPRHYQRTASIWRATWNIERRIKHGLDISKTICNDWKINSYHTRVYKYHTYFCLGETMSYILVLFYPFGCVW